MKKHAHPGSGFWLAFALNLVFRGEWLLAAFGALALHYLFGTPLFLTWIALAVWVAAALLVTLLVSWANEGGGESDQGQRTSERLRKKRESEREE